MLRSDSLRSPGGVPRRVWAGAGASAMTAEPGAADDSAPADDRRAAGWDPARVVLVVDDEASIVDSLDKIFRREGFTVLTATNGAAGLELLRRHRVGVLLSDLMMPGTTGMDLLRAAKTVAPETEVVLMTAYGTVETAVDAMKEGAYDFVAKPLKRAHVVRVVKNALEKQSLVTENRALKAQLTERRRRAIIGTSLPWRRTMDIVHQAAPSEATVLLLGESGSGKELTARAIHQHSPRSTKPFVALNCSAIPVDLIESELFGHMRGAFTGATATRPGLFEAADGGTLFLDEVGDLPALAQVKLLRALQEGEVKRVGANETRTVDVRVIAATNVDLKEAVKQGTFREDLYYRLSVVPIELPALRQRPEDILPLTQHFIHKYNEENQREISDQPSPEVLSLLENYYYPGNVRELENIIERAVVIAPGNEITVDCLRPEVRDPELAFEMIKRTEGMSSEIDLARGVNFYDEVKRFEIDLIRRALDQTGGHQSRAARLLGLNATTLNSKIKSYNIHTRQ